MTTDSASVSKSYSLSGNQQVGVLAVDVEARYARLGTVGASRRLTIAL